MRNLRVVAVFALALCALSGGALAVEGKWTPDQILEHDPKWLLDLGLELPPERLWSREGGGLLEAAVKIDGCSASFISERGLLITNHHCAFGILQQHSTPERDLITQGFLARPPAEELAGAGTRATVPHRIPDVTAEVEGAVPAGADDLARFRAIERKQKEMVAACEKVPNMRCQVAAFDGGVKYLRIEMMEFPDVRVVYSPPRSVGEYGGEIDNWSWPRHTGDFTLLRIYTGPDGQPAPRADANVAYRPRHYFPVSPAGIQPGSFVMLAGYPGLTLRSLIEPEMRERAELFFPRRAELYAAWIGMMETASAGDDTARIALADRMKTLANREKNARGQVAGIQRGRILENKAASERQILAWAAARPDQAGAVAAREELARLFAEKNRAWERDFLLDQAKSGAKPLDLALTLVRWAGEKAKPDLEREPDYQERERERLGERLERDQKRIHTPTEAAMITDFFARLAALP
ncbi:MAG TPA: S46 family peptidase, partial [Thermoanaerobaculia bacterium]|nr:S46 family peptidase [Thermoanaerobaculia bacterium]